MNAEMQHEPIRRKVVWGPRVRAMVAVSAALLMPSCSKAIRTGQSPVYLVMTSLQGAKGGGANANTFGTSLASDVITLVPALTGSPSIFSDSGQVGLKVQVKDLGGESSPNSPSAANAITLTQYHVRYFRTDGRNVQGVDVPYEFDGGMTFTVAGTGTAGFQLVRNQAKIEAPLKALSNNLEIINTIAEVTFYGHDQNGREVSVSGRIDIAFANFGD